MTTTEQIVQAQNTAAAAPNVMTESKKLPKNVLTLGLVNAITHQFNNLMMSVSGYAEVELKKAAQSEGRKLHKIVECASRATLLVQTLQACLQGAEPQPQKIDINDLARRLKSFLDVLIPNSREVELTLASSPVIILADPDQMVQALSCLVFHTTSAGTDGGLSIRTSIVSNTGNLSSSPVNDGSRAVLSIREKRSPNSETSHANLGDETIKAITELLRAGGTELAVDQRENGYEYKVINRVLASSTPAQPSPKQPMAASTRTILIVDDDASIRNAAAEFLRIEGFKVLQARDANEAMEMVQTGRFTLDLLVTDLVMGGPSGAMLAEKLKAVNSDLQVLFISGDATKSSELASLANNHVMQKPFRLDRMTEKIHEILAN